MNIFINILLILVGFIILIKCADFFVDGISSAAINFKVSKLIISLSIVAFGTSAPELAISFQGLINDTGDIVIANVVGSTIVNTLLIIGVAAIINPIKVKSETIKKQLPLHFIIILIFALLFLYNNQVTRIDALILFSIFCYFLYYIYNFAKKKKDSVKDHDAPKWGTAKSIIYSLIGLAGIFIGSDIAVDNCVELARAIGISEKLITMIVLVIGTSTPELVLAINSAKKKEFDICLGNIIGTNIFNIGFVLALPVLILGDIASFDFTIVDMFVMFLAGLYLFIYSKDDKVLTRGEGILMLSTFIIYYAYIFYLGL